MTANSGLATLESRLIKIEDTLAKLSTQMFAMGARNETVSTDLLALIAASSETQESLSLISETVIPPPDVLPSYKPVLTGPTSQVVSSVTGMYLTLSNHIVFYTAAISWSTVPTGGSGWSFNTPGNIFAGPSIQPTMRGYLYNSAAGTTSEFVGQISSGGNAIHTLTQGWGAAPGSWVGAGLSGSGSNATFMGWFLY